MRMSLISGTSTVSPRLRVLRPRVASLQLKTGLRRCGGLPVNLRTGSQQKTENMNPYSGTSTLAKVLRFSAVGLGVVYGSIKLSYYKSQAAKTAKQAHQAHH